MTSPAFQKKLLPGVIALALAGAPFQHLLAADENASKDDEAEVVEVRGIRDSLKANLADKRDADDIREVLTAEDIGKFPDKNVAESLQRISGIGIQRDFGEGERVSIRGTAPNLNRTLLNGHSVATADWFILDQLNATRSFNYLMLPSEVVGQLEVIKSPQADIEEGSIGGVVNVSTRKPLDMDSMTMAGSIIQERNDKSGESNPAFSGLISWKNDANNLGVLLSAITSESDIRRDGVEVLGYSNVDSNFDPYDAVADAGTPMLAIPDLIGSAYFTQKRERDAVNLSVQFAPTDALELTFNALSARMQADNINANYLAWFTRQLGQGGRPTNTVVDSNGTVLAGTFDDTSDWGAVYDVFVREGETKTEAYDIDVAYETGDWKLHGKLGTTDADGETSRQLIWETAAKTGFSWDLRGSAPLVQFTDIDPSSPDHMQSNQWNGERDVGNTDSEDFLYADAELALDHNVFNSIKFGIKGTQHERTVEFNGEAGHALYGPTSCGGQPCTLAPVAGGLLPSDFMSGHNVFGGYRLVSPEALYAIYNAIPSQGPCLPSGQSYPPSCYSPVASSSYDVEEDTLGAFVMARFSGDGIRGNVGVRVVETDVSATGVTTGVAATAPGALWNLFDGYYLPRTEKGGYTDVLPSFNIAFDVADDHILRFAAAKVMARPDYSAMAPNISLNSTSYTGSGGNPGLDPYRASQFDLSYEWYINDASALSLAYFYKDIRSYITNRVETEYHASFFDPVGSPPDAARCDDLGGNVWQCEYRVSRPYNGAGGRNEGWELSYQQVFENGFGFSGNYTRSDAVTNEGNDIPGNAKKTYNVSVFFENSLLSARVSLNSRDDFFIGIDRSREQWMEASEFVDASFSFNVNENIQLTLEGRNLTDEEIVTYYDGISSRQNAVYQTGPTYYAGVRLNF